MDIYTMLSVMNYLQQFNSLEKKEFFKELFNILPIVSIHSLFFNDDGYSLIKISLAQRWPAPSCNFTFISQQTPKMENSILT